MPLVLLLLALFALPSCSLVFGHRLELDGGHESTDGPDEIYFRARRVEGVGNGLCALLIPAHWKSQATRPLGEGRSELVEPLELQWTAGDDERLHARTGRFSGAINGRSFIGEEQLSLHLVFRDRHNSPLLDGSPRVPAVIEEIALDRLSEGHDLYVVVPLGREVRRGFELWGYRGPPLELVHLGDMAVQSGEGPGARFLTCTLGAVAYTLDASYQIAMIGLNPLLWLGGGYWIPGTEFFDRGFVPVPW